MSKDVIIIGAGVSGVTTALTLQCLGYDTEIIAKHTYDDLPDAGSLPEFASLFPAASIIPHSAHTDQLQAIFSSSQALFFNLRKQAFPGITFHEHYEVFEYEVDPPSYLDQMLNVQFMDELDPDSVPRRLQSPKLYGWSFDGLFADWPNYFTALNNRYTQHGGTITQQKLSTDDISQLPAPIIINCSGTGSDTLFKDPVDEPKVSRGHILHKAGTPLIKNSEDQVVSYNYTPQASLYSDLEGQPCDVYCYPRKDGWVLGGSRQIGRLHEQRWPPFGDDETYQIDGCSVPAQIIDLNHQILTHTYNKELANPDELTAQIGYRYIRNKNNGLRLEKEEKEGKMIIHNYGHGGAGVTLSWGCALAVAQKIARQEIPELKSALLQEL
ncbi:FAD-dependent oxidoreductase [Fodinibius salsisoli]|uniref:D-amino-acid oxidase n=1 Tax=Fodinibius salsisoli TaxID=2820877 RepID=A0ABT3PLG4_9BACT|nr:FAD-dependent oxidoreductase [Fodinibius salsisoli]MCW9706705.1 FAD-binding oxidoreductase [Fodinibius salsisoli]